MKQANCAQAKQNQEFIYDYPLAGSCLASWQGLRTCNGYLARYAITVNVPASSFLEALIAEHDMEYKPDVFSQFGSAVTVVHSQFLGHLQP